MEAQIVLPSRGRVVLFGQEEKRIFFTMRSAAELSLLHGGIDGIAKAIASISKFYEMPAQEAVAYMHLLASFVSAALIKSDSRLTPTYIEDNYDIRDVINILPEVVEEVSLALGAGKATTEAQGNENP